MIFVRVVSHGTSEGGLDLGLFGWRWLVLRLVGRGRRIVIEFFAVVDDAALRAELFVVGVFDDGADVDVAAAGDAEVQDALGLGVGGEPVLAVDLLVVGGEGWGEVFVALAGVVGDVLAVDEDDLEVLLIDPDLALKVTFVLLHDFGAGGEDVGVELVDLLAAEVGDVVLGKVGGGEDEGEALLDVAEVGWGHLDTLERVLGGEDNVLGALAFLVEGDVGNLLVLAVDAVGVFFERVDFYGLAKGVVLAGLVEEGFAGGELFDDLVGCDADRELGVETAEACGVLIG